MTNISRDDLSEDEIKFLDSLGELGAAIKLNIKSNNSLFGTVKTNVKALQGILYGLSAVKRQGDNFEQGILDDLQELCHEREMLDLQQDLLERLMKEKYESHKRQK